MFTLNFLAAREHTRELRDAAASARARAADSPVSRVTLRYAAAADDAGLRQLAGLDSGHAPAGPALIAEVDGRLRAALPLDGSPPLADPFHRGAELLELLRLRAGQLARDHRTRPHRA